MLTRRNLLAGLASFGCVRELSAGTPVRPATGQPVPQLEMIDTWVRTFMNEYAIEGAALSIARNGKIVYARGFGLADVSRRAPVAPDALFRIASVSKPITVVGVLQLVEAGQLDLNSKVLDVLPWAVPEGGPADARWHQITVEHCLTHSGGFDRDKSGDPTLDAVGFAAETGLDLPLDVHDVIREMTSRPLDFSPGTAYAYSNFGYALLGRVIERVSGREYEDYIVSQVLEPIGITRAAIGGSREAQRLPGEVAYYGDFESLAAVGPGAGHETVLAGDGAWDQRLIDAHGGWVFSASDLAKFGAALDRVGDRTRGGLLSAEMAKLMLGPRMAMSKSVDGADLAHYGYGWIVRSAPEGHIALHNGTLPTTGAMLMHFPDGSNLAFLTNNGLTPDGHFVGRMLQDPLLALYAEARDAISRL